MYLDTSIAAKLYLPEPESADIQRIVSRGEEIACAELMIPEFASVLSRRCREGALTKPDHDKVWSLLNEHIRDGYWNLLPVTRREFDKAAELIARCGSSVPLRCLDGLHLAVCLNYRVFPLFTSDRVMLKAAGVLGIPVQPLV